MATADGERRRRITNPNVGEFVCPMCDGIAYVRKKVNGKIYGNCPSCGIYQTVFRSGQEWLMKNSVMYGPTGELSDEERSRLRKTVSAPPPSMRSPTPMLSEPAPAPSVPASDATAPQLPPTPQDSAPTTSPPSSPTRKLSDLLL